MGANVPLASIHVAQHKLYPSIAWAALVHQEILEIAMYNAGDGDDKGWLAIFFVGDDQV